MKVVGFLLCGLALVASVGNCPGSYQPMKTSANDDRECLVDSDCGEGGNICGSSGSCCMSVVEKCPSTLACDECTLKGCAYSNNTCGLSCAGNTLVGCMIAAVQCPVATKHVEGNCEFRCGEKGWGFGDTSRRLQPALRKQVDHSSGIFAYQASAYVDEADADDASLGDKYLMYGPPPPAYYNPYGSFFNPYNPYGPPPMPPPQSNACLDARGGECRCSCNSECVAEKNCCFDYQDRCVF